MYIGGLIHAIHSLNFDGAVAVSTSGAAVAGIGQFADASSAERVAFALYFHPVPGCSLCKVQNDRDAESRGNRHDSREGPDKVCIDELIVAHVDVATTDMKRTRLTSIRGTYSWAASLAAGLI